MEREKNRHNGGNVKVNELWKIIMNNNQNGFFDLFLLSLILFHYLCVCGCVFVYDHFVRWLFALWYFFLSFFPLPSIKQQTNTRSEAAKNRKEWRLMTRFQSKNKRTQNVEELMKDFNRFNDTITRLMWQHKSHLITMILMSRIAIVFFSVDATRRNKAKFKRQTWKIELRPPYTHERRSCTYG